MHFHIRNTAQFEAKCLQIHYLLALSIQEHDLCVAAAAGCYWPAHQVKNRVFFTSKWLKTLDYVPFAVFGLNPNQCRVFELSQVLALGIQ
jgi:hypothetical protein